MHTSKTLFVALATGALMLTACASSRETASTDDSATTAQTISVSDSTPITAQNATLTISGLSCPLCAENVNKSLAGIEGVSVVGSDIGKGKVEIAMLGKTDPTRGQIARAVRDAGFTLVDITARN